VSAQLPSFGVIQAALRKTTEQLAHELHTPGTLAPAWCEFEWSIARAVATMQGISGLLATHLRWRGPREWQAYLDEHHGLAIQRDEVIDRTLAALATTCARHEVPYVALKGAALRAIGLYAPGERPMADIDILVREEHLPSVPAAMHALHYRAAFATRRHDVFEPEHSSTRVHAGEHPENSLKIEVHTRIAECLPVLPVDITAGLFPGKMRGGLNTYGERAALLRHLLLHAAGNMRANALRQIQLHDIAVLAAVLGPDDWDALTRKQDEPSGTWWMLPPLALVERYYQGSIPLKVLEQVAHECPPVLRATARRLSLTKVSWSNLRIYAFPGLAWARSPLEALRLIKSRVRPERRALEELSLAAKIQPPMGRLRWYEQSHWRRISRWLVSRPPRVQTMLSVCTALGIEP